MAVPELDEAPEAIEHIMNYKFFGSFGSGYTMKTLEQESYYWLAGIMKCMDSEAAAAKMRRERVQFYQDEGINIDAAHL